MSSLALPVMVCALCSSSSPLSCAMRRSSCGLAPSCASCGVVQQPATLSSSSSDCALRQRPSCCSVPSCTSLPTTSPRCPHPTTWSWFLPSNHQQRHGGTGVSGVRQINIKFMELLDVGIARQTATNVVYFMEFPVFYFCVKAITTAVVDSKQLKLS